MNIQLTWDLFVLVFFVIIVAYSLIIGQDNTLKVILGTYLAALTSDALGNLFAMNFAGSPVLLGLLKVAELGSENEAIVFFKVLVFVILVILFAIKGAYTVDASDNASGVMRIGTSIFYAILSAGLIISIILVFVSGVSFIGGGYAPTMPNTLMDLSKQSPLIQLIVDNGYILFSLPALAFLLHSFYSKKAGK